MEARPDWLHIRRHHRRWRANIIIVEMANASPAIWRFFKSAY
jgi:hypothetical protein